MSADADIEVVPMKSAEREQLGELQTAVLRVLIPVLLALVMGGIILLVLGKDPLTYYGYVLERGLLRWSGLQETLTRMAPLLLIASGLIIAFRAGIWNLGADGQFLLAESSFFANGTCRNSFGPCALLCGPRTPVTRNCALG